MTHYSERVSTDGSAQLHESGREMGSNLEALSGYVDNVLKASIRATATSGAKSGGNRLLRAAPNRRSAFTATYRAATTGSGSPVPLLRQKVKLLLDLDRASPER
jgi:hypothetical protein